MPYQPTWADKGREKPNRKLMHKHEGRRPRRPPSEDEPQRGRAALTPTTKPAGATEGSAERSEARRSGSEGGRGHHSRECFLI